MKRQCILSSVTFSQQKQTTSNTITMKILLSGALRQKWIKRGCVLKVAETAN